jgi:hypothetical protein
LHNIQKLFSDSWFHHKSSGKQLFIPRKRICESNFFFLIVVTRTRVIILGNILFQCFMYHMQITFTVDIFAALSLYLRLVDWNCLVCVIHFFFLFSITIDPNHINCVLLKLISSILFGWIFLSHYYIAKRGSIFQIKIFGIYWNLLLKTYPWTWDHELSVHSHFYLNFMNHLEGKKKIKNLQVAICLKPFWYLLWILVYFIKVWTG